MANEPKSQKPREIFIESMEPDIDSLKDKHLATLTRKIKKMFKDEKEKISMD